jgi:hypothetical protein
MSCQAVLGAGIAERAVNQTTPSSESMKTEAMARARRIIVGGVMALLISYLLLLIPASAPSEPETATRTPFLWNQEMLWSSLEARFKAARAIGCAQLTAPIEGSLSALQQQINVIAAGALNPDDARFDALETNLFQLAPMIAACPERLGDYLQVYSRLRESVKDQSRHWDMNGMAARRRIYRLLYGGRAALEEVMLQAPAGTVPALLPGHDEPSQTPGTNVLGVTLRSGDILVSRGGAANSALIARGNDFPGNFSHIALLYVDDDAQATGVIESHIEQGVAIATLQDYLQNKKLRIMVLRLRADLPQLAADPRLPHRAAAQARTDALAHHIPYDFSMDYQDSSKLFCSEVASAAYRRLGLTLWMGRSHLSARGLRAWLSAFGARHFETQEPADLEYDPQLSVVAEWRDPETLWKDHVDNAVIDAMLEGAEAGDRLEYSRLMLPFARVARAWSVVLNVFGKTGPIPEGMSATAALKNKTFSRNHAAIKARLLTLTDEFKRESGYTAPYWELIKLARKAKAGQ